MRFRDLSKTAAANDGTRSLLESTLVPEVAEALTQWSRQYGEAVLIGGVALSFWVKPRTTQDIDLLFLADHDIPNVVAGFRRSRLHAFVHAATGVEVELVTPTLVKVPPAVVDEVVRCAVQNDGMKIASASGLVALKLFRLSSQDKADIVALIKTGKVDLTEFKLPQDRIGKYLALVDDAANED